MTKATSCTLIGAVGSAIAGLFGGWSASLTTLCIFMAMDYISGLVCAGVFHASPKTSSGKLESEICFKGLIRKGMVLCIVLVAHRLDLETSTSYIRDGSCIAFMVNEAISIIENAGLMGVPIPAVVLKAIDTLKDRQNAEH